MIIKHTPSIVRKLWGGTKLVAMKGLNDSSSAEPVGETLEINVRGFPYLAKFIDTSDVLSIQVHPGDEYAGLHENSSGKTECWVILEAEKGAGIYLGLKPQVTPAVLQQALAEQLPINELLHFYEVRAGDFFLVPSGSIHAIGSGITLAEVQQNSGITYRVWDWNRMDTDGRPRELHVKKSLEVINFDPAANEKNYFRATSDVFHMPSGSVLCDHPQFQLSIYNYVRKGEVHSVEIKSQRPCSIMNLESEIAVNGHVFGPYEALSFSENEMRFSLEILGPGSVLVIN